MLHVTNGSVFLSRLHDLGVPGAIIPWDDVLHEGPVPAGLSPNELRRCRAEFLAINWGDVTDIERGLASRDQAVVDAMNSDPLIAHEVQPTRTVAELVRADERLKQEFPLITIPLLIMHGTADKVTNPKGSQFFFDTAGSSDKTLKLYDGHVHDLLNDFGRETVMADIVNWLGVRS